MRYKDISKDEYTAYARTRESELLIRPVETFSSSFKERTGRVICL